MQGKTDAQAMTIEAVLAWAKDRHAPMSCRAEGVVRNLAKLHCLGFLPGQALDLCDFGWRDRLPRPGMMVHMAILVADDLYFLKARVLGSIHGDEPPVLRLGWPVFSALPQRRERLAVAVNGLPALPALIGSPGAWLQAQVLNLTGRFADLGLAASMPMELHQGLEAHTQLPDGSRLTLAGSVLRFAWVQGDPQPMRLRLALASMALPDEEALCRFILGRNLAAPCKLHAKFRLKHPAPPSADPSGLDPVWFRSLQRPGTAYAHAAQG